MPFGVFVDPLHAEAELIERAKTDPDAFGELYERYIERIYNYVYFRVGSVHDAEDLTARVFLKALNNLNRYRFVGLPFSAWLYRIAHNLIANHHRDQSRRREIPIEDMAVVNIPARLPAIDASMGRAQEAEALWKMINDLSPQKRELILLKFVEKLSNSEIAAVLNKSESAIKSLYHRTLLEMRERIDRADFD
ncbi:MAG: RNA polymerase sigma factor [Anaerolineaceae bacterium]